MLACWRCKGSSTPLAHVRYYPGMQNAGTIQAFAVTRLEWGTFLCSSGYDSPCIAAYVPGRCLPPIAFCSERLLSMGFLRHTARLPHFAEPSAHQNSLWQIFLLVSHLCRAICLTKAGLYGPRRLLEEASGATSSFATEAQNCLGTGS